MFRIRRFIVVAVLTVSAVRTSAQSISYSGVVQDSLNKPIPYATIIEQKGLIGVLSNGNGEFTIVIPDSLTSSTLSVSCIGYETTLIQIKDLKTGNSNEITLHEKQFILATVTVLSSRAKFCPEVRGVNNNKSKGNFLMKSGEELALFIPTTPADSGIVKAVRYYIRKEGVPDSPFRVKLYKVNSITKGPGELLLDHDTIVRAERGNRWCEIDLSAFNIPVPENGFFVAMQWLHDSKPYTKMMGDHTMSGNGQIVGLVKEPGMIHYWRTLTGSWINFQTVGNFHPMFAAVLSKECK
jgi:hypothetical protein